MIDEQSGEVLTPTTRRSDTITEIVKALCKVQGAMKPAIRDTQNPFFKSRYADLSSVWESVRPLLLENGLCVVQGAAVLANVVRVDTTVFHESGEWFSCELEAEAKDASPQSVGSCVTYLRRYGMSPLLGIVTEDDDGEAAQNRGGQTQTTTTAPAAGRTVTKDDLRPPSAGRTVTKDDLRPPSKSSVLTCPKCRKSEAVIKGKTEYGGGFVCYKAKGGCGFKGDEDTFRLPPFPTKEETAAKALTPPPPQGDDEPPPIGELATKPAAMDAPDSSGKVAKLWEIFEGLAWKALGTHGGKSTYGVKAVPPLKPILESLSIGVEGGLFYFEDLEQGQVDALYDQVAVKFGGGK